MALARKAIIVIDVVALCASIAYLTVEVAFHSRLVDLLGVYPSKDEIEQAEHVGRFLTGLALALVLVPVALKMIVPIIDRNQVAFIKWAIAIIAVLGTLSIAAARVSIESVVEGFATNRTAMERRQAVLSLFIVSHLHKQQGGLPALTLNEKHAPTYLRETVPGRLVLAALPFLLSNVSDLEQRTRQQMRAILADDLESKLGRPEKLYNDVFVRGMASLALAFQNYQKATSDYNTRMRRVEPDAYSDWESYTDELSRNRLTPATATRSPAIRQRVSDALRRRDPSIPPNWLPASAEDFRVLRVGALQNGYENALRGYGFRDPSNVPRFPTFQNFLQHSDIRTGWCNSLQSIEIQLRDNLCRFGPREGDSAQLFPAFEQAVFAPLVDNKLNELVAHYNSPVEAYADGGAFAKEGYDAAKTAIVIPVALFFSLFGGVIHAIKCTWLLSVLLFSRLYVRLAIPTFVFSVLAIATVVSPVPMQDDAFVAAMRRAIREKSGETILGLSDSALKLEPVVYPTGKALSLSFFANSRAATQ